MATLIGVRSFYSLLNGTMSVEEMVVAAKTRGYTSVALTEHKVMFSTLEFYKTAIKHNIKPIMGLEVELEDGLSVVLARDYEGLIALHALSFEMSKGTRFTAETLQDYASSLIFILYTEAGPLESDILKNNWDDVTQKLHYYQSLFPDFLLGLSHQESSFFKGVNEKLLEVAALAGIDCVPVPKVYYKDAEDHDILRALQAVDRQTHINDSSLNLHLGRWLLPRSEYELLYSDTLRSQADAVAMRCNVNVLERKAQLPRFVNNQDVPNDIYLNQLSAAGLKRRLNNNVTNAYKERLAFELDVINSMSFTDYFLIVYDVIRYAKVSGINVGPGRGSSAGSLVAYALGITEVDPIRFGLLFERFLNPERITMPDIDIDFPDNKREQVIAYTKEKYGVDHVANIITFGTFKAKQSFRDAGRVLQVPLSKVNQVTRLLSTNSLQDTFDTSSRLRTLVHSDKQLIAAFELAKRLENIPRHASTHAAGIVVVNTPLLDIVPVYAIDHDTQCVQYDMSQLEELGLIKIDYLGIRNLTIIANVVETIQKSNPEFNLKSIPYDDRKTFALLSDANTLGIFQLESDGMKNLMKRMKPHRFLDIVDAIALFRPGPMENIPVYLENRKHPASIEYIHQDLKPITESTYGVLVYQEQIMETAQVFAGFSLAKADILRRAMGKKDATILEGLRVDFIEGSVAKGYDVTLAETIYALIYKFANYGFNKSHSVAYSMISYQLAYLKANYPLTFNVFLLNSVIGSDVKTGQYLEACRRSNLTISGLDINKSTDVYYEHDQTIQLPFTVIKGVSSATALMITDERTNFGNYTSVFEAFARLLSLKISKKSLESFVDCGVFDSLYASRATLRENFDALLQYADLVRVYSETERFDFSLVSEPLLKQANDKASDRLKQEIDHLGFYVSDHPITGLRSKHQLKPLVSLAQGQAKSTIVVIIDRIKQHRTKTGTMMAFLAISDDTGTMDAVCFPKVYETISESLVVGDIALLKGYIKEENSFIIDEIRILRDSIDLHLSATRDITLL